MTSSKISKKTELSPSKAFRERGDTLSLLKGPVIVGWFDSFPNGSFFGVKKHFKGISCYLAFSLVYWIRTWHPQFSVWLLSSHSMGTYRIVSIYVSDQTMAVILLPLSPPSYFLKQCIVVLILIRSTINWYPDYHYYDCSPKAYTKFTNKTTFLLFI